MTYTIAVIGLNVVGTSIGLALRKNREVRRLGHDRDPKQAQEAKKQGAVDEIHYSLPQAVEGANLILLTEPLSQLEETFQMIGPELQEGTVVMDFAPIKRAPAEWAARYLPSGCAYVGLKPTFNPQVLNETEWHGREDLFANGLIAVAAPVGTPASVLQLAEDLIVSLGARPLFSDASEIDGLVSRANLLPALTAAAMLHTTLGRPGWQEARKMAGVAYRAFLNALLSDEAASLEQTSLLNRDNVLRALDDLLSSLQELRAHLEADAVESLGEYFWHARMGGQKWWEERQAGLWDAPSSGAWNEIPSFGERMSQSLFGGRKR